DLIFLGNNRFKANHVKPEAIVEFLPGTAGSMSGLKWVQRSRVQEWNKVVENNTDTACKSTALLAYAGKYKLKGNAYMVFTIGVNNDHLTAHLENEDKINLYLDSKDYFVLKDGEYWNGFRFTKDNKGEFTKIITDAHGAVECVRVSSNPIELASSKHSFYNRTNFTHADTLLGKL